MSKVRLHISRSRWSEILRLEGSEVHRLTQVLRLKAGQVLEVFDGEGSLATARLRHAEDGSWDLCMSAEKRRSLDLAHVVLVVALLKGRRLDDVIRQVTELGVARILPVLSGRSVARPEAERACKRLERWRVIAAEAARQSGRSDLPRIDEIRERTAFLAWLADEGAELDGVIFHEKSDPSPAEDLWSAGSRRRLVMTGPEGGFSEEEVEVVLALGLRVGHMGPTVLRADTAAVVASALAVLTGARGSDK